MTDTARLPPITLDELRGLPPRQQFDPNLQVYSPQAIAFQQAIAKLPDPQDDAKAYRKAIAALNDKFADFLRLHTQLQLVELANQNPDEFMKVMPRILDNFIPKMKSVEAKVDAVIDNRIYVETAYREPVPVDALKRAGVVIESSAEPTQERASQAVIQQRVGALLDSKTALQIMDDEIVS